MSEKYTNEQVADIVRSEGLDYAITNYMGADSIEDPELAQAWENARQALAEVERLLPNEEG